MRSAIEELAASEGELVTLLDEFAAAYNRHDVEAIMSFMTDDCVFVSYFGPDVCGEKFTGRETVRNRVATGLADFPDARWDIAGHFVSGNRGVSEWIFRGTRRGASELIERQGIDVFTFNGGKIQTKATYQKWRQPVGQNR